MNNKNAIEIKILYWLRVSGMVAGTQIRLRKPGSLVEVNYC